MSAAPQDEVPRPPVSIAGVGNWLLTSDRIGPRVLELARDRYGAEVELCEVGSGGLSLIDHLHGQELLVVVDACLLGGAPGQITLIHPGEQELPGTGGSVHQIGPLEALAVAAQLLPAECPRRSLIIAVETEGLDEAGEADACRRVLELLDQQIAAWRSAR